MSSGLTIVSDPMYSLIHAATSTAGNFRTSMASMITWCETWSKAAATSQSITKIGICHSVASLFHHASQDGNHLVSLTSRDVAILWATSSAHSLARQLKALGGTLIVNLPFFFLTIVDSCLAHSMSSSSVQWFSSLNWKNFASVSHMSSSSSLSISITKFPEVKRSLPYPPTIDGRQGLQHFPRPSMQ